MAVSTNTSGRISKPTSGPGGLPSSNPDEFRNLLVRVTGYNAYFVNLGREIQEEIIARELHQL